ncbi:hypothetical protein K501DRAFT_250140 [Backusella circina FSU 941]|nr:hypothetical protein K501DRAFT_250140 [Backusella circina FSU 941]
MWTPLNISIRTFVSARFLNPKKFTSILADVPVRPRNPWQIYLRENLTNYRKDTGKIDTKIAAKELGKKWKVMGDAEKKVFVETYEREAELHKKALENALQKATPKQFYEENQLRTKYNLTKLKDPKAPRPPKNAFLIYLEHLRKANDPIFLKDTNVKDHAIAAGIKYRSLPDSEKKVFSTQAEKLMKEYKVQKAKYNAMIEKEV